MGPECERIRTSIPGSPRKRVPFNSIFDAQDVLASSFWHTSEAPSKCVNCDRAAGHLSIKDRSERRQSASPPLSPAIILYLLPFHHDLADRASKASHLYSWTPLSFEFGETPSRLCREPAGHLLARPVPSACTALFTLGTR